MYWAFTPKEETFIDFEENLDKAKNTFPINVYYDVYDQFEEITTSTPDTINMIGIFSDVELLSSTTLKTNIASDTWENIYDSIEIIIFALTFIYFAHYIFRNNKQE